MNYMLSTAVALCVALGGGHAVAQDREVILNYSDPHGAALALALVPHVEKFPHWMSEIGDTVGRDKQDVTLILQSGESGPKSRYILSTPRLGQNARAATQGSTVFELNSAIGKSIEVRGENDKPKVNAVCTEPDKPSDDCKFSRPTTEVVLLLAKSASKNSAGLSTLFNEGNLTFDTRSVKRVVVRFDADGHVEQVDFVGVLRGRQEHLAPPDATSANVLRLHSDGWYEVVRRTPDTRVDLNDINFGFEGLK